MVPVGLERLGGLGRQFPLAALLFQRGLVAPVALVDQMFLVVPAAPADRQRGQMAPVYLLVQTDLAGLVAP